MQTRPNTVLQGLCEDLVGVHWWRALAALADMRFPVMAGDGLGQFAVCHKHGPPLMALGQNVGAAPFRKVDEPDGQWDADKGCTKTRRNADLHSLGPRPFHCRMIGHHGHGALHHLTRWKRQVYRLVRIELNPAPSLGVELHKHELHLVVLEGQTDEGTQQKNGGSDPDVEGHSDARPGHQDFMVEQLRSAREIACVPLHFSARGSVGESGSFFAEPDVFSHDALARWRAPERSGVRHQPDIAPGR